MSALDTSYLVTHVNSVSAAALSALDTNGLPDGARATVTGLITVPTVLNTDKPLYVLVKGATNAANGTTSLNTLNSNGGATAGRWIRINAAILG